MEQEKPEKAKASDKRFQQQFISPFSLESCVSRLESRTEKPTLWAWKGQMRVKTEVWKIDSDSAGFIVYKAPKSSMQLQFGTSPTSAKGAMFRQADGTTTVLVKAGTTTIGYAIYGLLMLALWVMLTVSFIVPMIRTSIALGVGISAAGLFGGIALSLYYFDSQHAQLLRIVRESLGDERVFE